MALDDGQFTAEKNNTLYKKKFAFWAGAAVYSVLYGFACWFCFMQALRFLFEENGALMAFSAVMPFVLLIAGLFLFVYVYGRLFGRERIIRWMFLFLVIEIAASVLIVSLFIA